MNQVRITRFIGVLSLAFTLGACGTTPKQAASPALADQAPASENTDHGPDPAGEVAKHCFGGSLAMLKAGLVGVPLSIIGVGVCLPLTAGVGILHAIFPTASGSGGLSYSDSAQPGESNLNPVDRSMFPQSPTSGCALAYCLTPANGGYR